MVAAGVYGGGVRWAVRYAATAAEEVKVREYPNEEQARAMYDFLMDRFAESDRPDRPELVSAKIHWQVQG